MIKLELELENFKLFKFLVTGTFLTLGQVQVGPSQTDSESLWHCSSGIPRLTLMIMIQVVARQFFSPWTWQSRTATVPLAGTCQWVAREKLDLEWFSKYYEIMYTAGIDSEIMYTAGIISTRWQYCVTVDFSPARLRQPWRDRGSGRGCRRSLQSESLAQCHWVTWTFQCHWPPARWRGSASMSRTESDSAARSLGPPAAFAGALAALRPQPAMKGRPWPAQSESYWAVCDSMPVRLWPGPQPNWARWP